MTNITDDMAEAGARVLDPLLDRHDPLKVARQVLEAAHGIAEEKPQAEVEKPWAGSQSKQPVVF